MQYSNLEDFLKTGVTRLGKGPLALIMVEDLVEVESTIRHHQKIGFAQLILFAPPELSLPEALEQSLHRVDYDVTVNDAVQTAVNGVNEAAPNRWLYYCYNAEYLFHPFAETRSIGEMLAFHTEERRDAVLSYVIDLYPESLDADKSPVSLTDAHLDGSGYFAQDRLDADDAPKERQKNFYGGLRWRFEEHIPVARRKIDRIALFKSKPGLCLNVDHTFNDEEYNTYSCPWHHNITVAIVSFRLAKALKSNAGSRFEINTFKWQGSVKFGWESQQLMDLGLMEPGQWF